ncbi:gluconate 2-dehydrogenase subunit 3 family protein [Parapedobacter sp. ISTM3]|uniref:Gluconate 2-dehydrogenase subunit 3 n=1 Tax=Parapedobacter luteus TaxID=623280 RepID=A0A1T5EZT4_9SPHI|nr:MULTISPECIES: gluconate 2-dehydrogenase subunit 3 family protein [Parapedobacter]MBK1439309.1 gluconate 2-dehydrogenase subunit 3 family protein [Parapedobacter sp. ISTM3]SKB89452.1 Gluconate 2-dehydrogenase subunit 3 [Parapedobacter luteus]
MNRREALARVAWIMGGAVVGANLFLEGCTRKATKHVEGLFEPEMVDFLGDVADTILPPTSSPGAKEAGVGAFIPVMVKDCYTANEQKTFVDGLGKLEDAADEKFGRKFQELNATERTELLAAIDKEAKDYQKSKTAEDPDHYFHLFKQLTLLGFFTSELGATKALRYVQIPGRYDGDYPYKKGDKAWAT